MQMSIARPTARTTTAVHIPAKLTVWVALNVMDALLTFYLIGLGGIEGNPMLAYLQGEIGIVGMLLTKVALATLVGGALIAVGKARLLRIANWLMSAVVVYNTVIMFYVLNPTATLPFVS